MENLLLSLLLFFSYNSINGIVYDKNTGECLTGVRIITPNDTLYTDFNGRFFLENTHDTINISIDFISYEKIDTILINDKSLITNIQ